MDKEQRDALRKLSEPLKGWINCNQAWLDTSEDESAAVVGHIDEDGETYPVAVIDCDQYYQGQDSLPLAKFYAAANPSTILQLLDYIEALEKDAGRYRWLRDAENSMTEDDPCVSDGFFNSWYGEDLDKVIDELIERNVAIEDYTNEHSD